MKFHFPSIARVTCVCVKMPRYSRSSSSSSSSSRYTPIGRRISNNRMASDSYVMKRGVKNTPKRKYKRLQLAMKSPTLMGCTKHYLSSILDPVGEDSRGACVPSGFPMASQKVRQFLRGTIPTNATGDGFICWRPTFANDAACVSLTSGSSVWTAGTALSGATNLTTLSMATLPYTSAQCTSANLDQRFVSGCLRIRYTGTEDARGGIISVLEEPDHNDLLAQTGTAILSYENCQRSRPSGDGEWTTVCWSGPVRQSEVDYISATNLNYMFVILLKAPSTTVMNFEWEIWQNIEYIGSIPTGKTDSHVDPTGMSAVLTGTKKVSSTQPIGSTESKNSVMSNIAQGISNIDGHINTAKTIVKTARKVPDWLRKTIPIVRKIATAIATRGRSRY